jgi:hypothetical protein
MDSTQDQPSKIAKPNGRPPFKVTTENQAKVAGFAKLGVPQDQIAFSLRISPNTLRKHFRNELYEPAVEANRQVLAKIFELAISGNLAAATFWARTRCKFRAGGSSLDAETSQPNPPPPPQPPDLEFSNNDGAPREEW